MKDLKFIRYAQSCIAMAFDFWLMVIVILWAFDKPVRWYVWMMFSLEFLTVIANAVRYNNEKDKE